MHELSVAQRIVGLMSDVSAKHGGVRVVAGSLLLGELSCIDPDTLRFAFDVACRGTMAEGCQLEIARVPLWRRCKQCEQESGGEILQACPNCGGYRFEVLRGREIRLNTVDIDDGEEE